MTAADPVLARSFSALRPADSTPARSVVAIVVSMTLMFVDVELIAAGLHDHPVFLIVGFLGSPCVVVPIVHCTKHPRH